jgi:DNA-binding transcriptional LysR family regulator
VIDKLDYLLALARERHFGRAAESCGVTQPSFSAGIKVLEDMLGMPLVERSSRFRGFTPEGERVLEWARRILGDVHAMRADVSALKHSARHPNVRFSIQSCTSNEVLRRLENFEVDAGVTYLDNESIGRARMIPLYEERYRLLTSADAPLGHREQVSWSELGEIPLCLLTPDMQNRRILDRLLQNAGVTVEPTLESNSIVVLVSHVQTGRWACILPEKLALIFGLTAKLRIIPIINPEEVHTVGLVLPDRDPLSPLVSSLAALARERGGLG